MRSKLSAITARMPSSSVPLAAQSRDEPGAVFLADERHQRHVLGRVALGGVEDRERIARGQMRRVAALLAARERVAQADVAERAPHHDLVVAAARAERVEVARSDSVLRQVAAGGHVARDRPGGRDVVGRDRVSEQHEAARVDDVRRGAAARAACPGRTTARARRWRPRPRRRARPPGPAAPASARRRPRSSRTRARTARARRWPRWPRAPRRWTARARAGRRRRPRCRCRAARARGRRRSSPPVRRRRRAGERRGSWRARAGGCGPRSCDCPRARRRRRARRRARPRRSRPRAAPSCRCRSCSRSRRAGSPACRAAPAARPPRGSR